MTKEISNVEDYKVVADNGFQFNVKVRGLHNYGNRKWMIEKVGLIRDYFTFTDGADRGLIIDVIVNTHEIIVKAEFNGKKYWAYPIHPKFGKKQIREMLSNMGVVADVMAVYTNNMVNNNMEENDMVDMTGIDENGLSIEGLEYVNENMETVDVELIKDCIKDFSEDSYVMDRVFGWQRERRVDFEEFCDRLWADFVWERVLDSGCTDEALENETRYVMEFNDRVRYIVEHEIDLFGINCYDEIVVEDLPKNSSPCLDDVERVVKVIKDYVINYEGMLMDYNGFTASMCVPWDVFNEDDMKMLIEDEMFEVYVDGCLMISDIYDMLVYDDGVYVSVDVKKYDKVA